jgi:PKD repeat protein
MPICLSAPLLAAALAANVLAPAQPDPGASSAPLLSQGTASTPSPVVIFSSPGEKTVTLKVCNSGGCSSATKTVTILDPVPSIASVSGPTTVGTSDAAVTFSATARGKPPLAYNWTLTQPDGSHLTANSRTFTWIPRLVGSHQLALNVSNLWGSKTSTVPVAVVPTVFADIPPSFWASSFIETFYFSGFTAGCSLGPDGSRLFCPANLVSRAELAVFLGRAVHPPPFAPPPASGLFSDVPAGYWAAPWIEQSYRDGITGGCAAGPPPAFCPQSPATRAEIAVELGRALHGPHFVPPAPTGLFADVPVTYWAASWIEQSFRDGITAGCQGPPTRLFCPSQTTTRAEVAVFFVRAFHLSEQPSPLAFAARLCSPSACAYPAGMPIDFKVQVSGGIPASYDFDWNGDGTFEESVPFPVPHVYPTPGTFTPRLRLRLGSWSRVIVHPYPIRINPASTAMPLPPTTIASSAIGLIAPLATDPPGTRLRVAYSLSAVDPPGILGYAAYVNTGGSYQFAGLLAAHRATAGDFLLLSPAAPGEVRYLAVRAFSSNGFGPSSLPVRLP